MCKRLAETLFVFAQKEVRENKDTRMIGIGLKIAFKIRRDG